MKNIVTPKYCFVFCKIAGLGLLFAFWVQSGETTGFFLLLFLVVMSLLRYRVPRLGLSVFLDFALCAALYFGGELPAMMMALPLFEAMALGYSFAAFCLIYLAYRVSPPVFAGFAFAALCGFFLACWERERKGKQLMRDREAGRYYELEELQRDLIAALAQIEQMTAVHERARIARDIHDNAGHEIIAAYMSFQSLRNLLPDDNGDLSALYDTALERLHSGTGKIREAVHNLGTASFFGVERLRQKCEGFAPCEVDFKVYGDTARVPIYVWSMLESCLGEALTNIARHSAASWVSVELDATPYLVRLCVENDGVRPGEKSCGSGLRNLRHRAAAIGGSLTADGGEVFSVVCVVPLRPKEEET